MKHLSGFHLWLVILLVVMGQRSIGKQNSSRFWGLVAFIEVSPMAVLAPFGIFRGHPPQAAVDVIICVVEV